MDYTDYQNLRSERDRISAIAELLFEIRDRLPNNETEKNPPLGNEPVNKPVSEPVKTPKKKAIKVLAKGIKKNAKGTGRTRKKL